MVYGGYFNIRLLSQLLWLIPFYIKHILLWLELFARDLGYDDERNEVNCREGNLLHCLLTKESDMVKIVYKYFYNPLHFPRNI